MLARTDPDIRKGFKGLTGFIVDADTPGVTKGRKVNMHCLYYTMLYIYRNGTWANVHQTLLELLLKM